jgi:hypothetical protein
LRIRFALPTLNLTIMLLDHDETLANALWLPILTDMTMWGVVGCGRAETAACANDS